MAGGGGGTEVSLEFTPTYVVAVVCSIIVIISLIVERSLHHLGKKLQKADQKPLHEALVKIKEELMLLGFISLLLVAFQTKIVRFCVPKNAMKHMLPCKAEQGLNASSVAHFGIGVTAIRRRLLAGGASGVDYCANKGKVPLLSIKAIHDLHIFIFVLGVTHVIFCAITLVLSLLRIRQWRHFEDSIQKEIEQNGKDQGEVIHIQKFDFIQHRFKGCGSDSGVVAWLVSFFKQFYASITKSDYQTMRLGFIKAHCEGNPKFNFYKYMLRVLESDFKKVIGIKWYLWIFMIIFLLLNVHGWYMYFWAAFIPLLLLLAVGAELENVRMRMAHDTAKKSAYIEGPLIINLSDDYFWFHRPRILIYLLHFILFQNAFEVAFFFWIWTAYGFKSCMMERLCYLIPRLGIAIFIQILSSYSTLPLYAIVAQMGTLFKKEIFKEPIQEGIYDWINDFKKRKWARTAANMRGSGDVAEGSSSQDKGSQSEISVEPSSLSRLLKS